MEAAKMKHKQQSRMKSRKMEAAKMKSVVDGLQFETEMKHKQRR